MFAAAEGLTRQGVRTIFFLGSFTGLWYDAPDDLGAG